MNESDFIVELHSLADKVEKLQDDIEGSIQEFNSNNFTEVSDEVWDAVSNLTITVDGLVVCVNQIQEEII